MANCRVFLPLMSICLLASLAVASAQIVNGKADLLAANQAMKKAGVFNTWLRLMRTSGFEGILARYIQTQPVTVLAPVDAAFNKLPLRIKSQLNGPKLIKLLEFHMLLQKLPFKFLQFAQPGGEFRTVYGANVVKVKASMKTTVLLKPKGATKPSQVATITRPDILNLNRYLTLAVEGINNVLIPPNVFF